MTVSVECAGVRVLAFRATSLNAGVDLLLVAYDGAQFYRIFACALDASRQDRLDATALRASELRLGWAFPGD
jgi:beta-N-acetylhexosaminidase